MGYIIGPRQGRRAKNSPHYLCKVFNSGGEIVFNKLLGDDKGGMNI